MAATLPPSEAALRGWRGLPFPSVAMSGIAMINIQDMRIFATRVWGFDPVSWPVITFGLEGNRGRLLKESEVGDCILFVGTQGEPTDEEERGRLLGIARIGRIPVETLSVLDPSAVSPHDYDEHGRFRWPKALAMTQAWAFRTKPYLKDVLAAQLPYNATTQAVPLDERDATAVMELEAEEIMIPSSEPIERLRTLEAALSAGKPTRGVVPTAWSREVGRTLGNPSVTYAMRYGKTDCWKIGHAVDAKTRLAEINRHVPHEVTGARWALWRVQKWPDETMAYAMEQKLFGALVGCRTEGERVRCPESSLHEAWMKAIGAGK